MEEHGYDIISFDFKSAFDQVPHRVVIEVLATEGVYGIAMGRYGGFLSGRLQQLKVGNCISCVCDVISGVVQGSTNGSRSYTLVADTLRQVFSLPQWAFTDDFKFIADIATHRHTIIQAEVNKVVQWSDERQMPLTFEKCGVMHCGVKQPNYIYSIHERSMTFFDSF